MKYRTAVFTVVFKKNLQFLKDFSRALRAQTYQDFDVFLINDDLSDHEIQVIFNFTNVEIIEGLNDVRVNRMLILETAINSNYENIIFLDSDDFPSKNYLEICVDKLTHSQCVVSDISPFWKSDQKILQNYWSSRIPDGQLLNTDFIKSKNVVGLGNTSIKRTVLKPLEIPMELVAVDWYLFSILLKGLTWIFSSKSSINYRQHQSNTVGIMENSIENLARIAEIKRTHYLCMTKFDDSYFELLQSLDQLLHEQDLEKVASTLDETKHYFWYEQIPI